MPNLQKRKKQPAKTDEPGFVYVMASNEVKRVKIGYSAHPPKRLTDLSTGSPTELFLLATWRGTAKDEEMIQERLSKYCSHLEWFDLDGHVAVQYVTSLMAGSINVCPSRKEVELFEKLRAAENNLHNAKIEIDRLSQTGQVLTKARTCLQMEYDKFRKDIRLTYRFGAIIGACVLGVAFTCGDLYRRHELGMIPHVSIIWKQFEMARR